MSTIDYAMVDIANTPELLQELMDAVVNHPEFPYAVATACEIESGNAFVRLVQEIALEFAEELVKHSAGEVRH